MLRRSLLLLPLLMIGVLGTALGQSRTVKGVVRDAATKEGLPGVSVLLKGTSTGVTTDFDGNYTIQIDGNDATLVFSFVGYASQEVAVSSRATIDILLEEEASALSEVIVVGYTSQTKRSLTGSVSSLEGKELTEVPAVSLEQALQGRVAGVTVGNEGSPGGGAMVRIRGFGTIGYNDPLYVIDGTPTTQGLNEINPNDIENIQVLKDASAASIYGSRAANGVVIVTTKKGSQKGASITLDTYYGTNTVPQNRFPEMLTPTQLADVIWESQINANGSASHPQYGSGDTPVIPDYLLPTGAMEGDPGVNPSLYNNDPDDPNFYTIVRANQEGTDWFNEVFQPATLQSYNLSAQGGGASGTYALSAGYYSEDGVMIHTNFDRYTLRMNSTFKVKDRVEVGENFSVAYTERVGPAGGNQDVDQSLSMMYRIPGIIPVTDIMGNYAGTRGGGLGNASNPVAMAFWNKDNKDRRIRAFGNAYAKVTIMDGLSIKSSIGVDYNTNQRSVWTYRNSEDGEARTTNSYNEVTAAISNWTWYNTLNYSKEFGESKIDAFVGTEAIEGFYREFGAGRTGYFSNELDYRSLNTGSESITNYGFGSSFSLFSIFGQVNYSLKDRYLLSATARRDGSSRFGPNNKFGVFPAASVGWIVSDEGFMQGVGLVSNLKVRAGWGQTGNQEIDNYSFASSYAADLSYASYDLGGTNSSVFSGFDLVQRGNADVRWETTTTTNVGVDVNLLNNDLFLTLDWYTRETSDMLVQEPVPGTAGQANPPFVNVGSMRNTGLDLSLNYFGTVNDLISYEVGGNFSTYRNEVLNLGSDPNKFLVGATARSFNPTRTSVGQPISYFYGWEVEGIFQTQAEVDAANAAAAASTGNADAVFYDGVAVGRFKFRDLNGDGLLTDDDRTIIGNPHPDFTYGLNLKVNVGDFSLTAFLQGVEGNDIFNFTKYFTDFENFQGNRSTRILDSWSPDNTGASLPQLNSNRPALESNPSSYFIEDGSYMRVKNLMLAYNMPSGLASNLGFSNVRVYVQGKNLLTFTQYEGLDPEINLRAYYDRNRNLDIGVDRGAYPVPRTLLVGANLTF